MFEVRDKRFHRQPPETIGEWTLWGQQQEHWVRFHGVVSNKEAGCRLSGQSPTVVTRFPRACGGV
jgi:hypothetical protein